MTEDLKKSPIFGDGKDEMDNIMGGGDFFDEVVEKNSDKVKKDNIESANVLPSKSKDKEIEEIPALRGEGYPTEYLGMVDRIQWQYKMLPFLDYDAIYKEIADLSVKACPTPTLQILNDEIQKVQGAKDRLSEIFINIYKCYNFKKRAVDILHDAWGKFTPEKNAEGRKGDASFRLSNFLLDFATVESLLKACTHILKNLDSLHDSLSRRITIYQLTMKLHDVGRSALPDYDFDKPSEKSNDDINDLFSERSKDKDDSDGIPELRSF